MALGWVKIKWIPVDLFWQRKGLPSEKYAATSCVGQLADNCFGNTCLTLLGIHCGAAHMIRNFYIPFLSTIKGIRDAGSTADFRILFEIFEILEILDFLKLLNFLNFLKFWHFYTVTLLHFHTFILSHFHTFALSHFHTFTLSHFHTFTRSHFHTFTLSPFHTSTLLHFHILTISHFHAFTVSHLKAISGWMDGLDGLDPT